MGGMASNRRDGSLSGLEEQQDLDIEKREKHSKQREQTEGRHRGMNVCGLAGQSGLSGAEAA